MNDEQQSSVCIALFRMKKFLVFESCMFSLVERTCCMGPYAVVDYNLTLCRRQSRLQHIYHGQLYARVDLNSMPESTLSPSQGLRIWPQGERQSEKTKLKWAKGKKKITENDREQTQRRE